MAIDQRGYNLSDQPEGVENYTLDKLVGDVDAVVRLLVTLQVLSAEKPAAGGTEWIAVTPAGYYTAPPGATKLIRWREGDRLLPAKAHAGRLRRPDLVAKPLCVR